MDIKRSHDVSQPMEQAYHFKMTGEKLPNFDLRQCSDVDIENDQTLELMALIRRQHSQLDQHNYPEGSRGYYAMATGELAISKFLLSPSLDKYCSSVRLEQYNTDYDFVKNKSYVLK
ncbi:MAG TPA: hypothetical protein VL485_07165 [Ktedonobacteraceae bacterium]|jgi:hypothetical protein|nr:hypothetical protein [Ktedonobacteraceae bacterium]